MASKSLVKNEYFNKLQVNKLNSINNLNKKLQKKYLININVKNAKYENNLLIFNVNDFNALFFSDRPYRFVTKINANKINNLFNDNYQNSFKEDKPNAVLTTNDGQAVFEVMEEKYINNELIFTLNPLKNDLPNFNGNISLFIDNTAGCIAGIGGAAAGLGLGILGGAIDVGSDGTLAIVGTDAAYAGATIFLAGVAQAASHC